MLTFHNIRTKLSKIQNQLDKSLNLKSALKCSNYSGKVETNPKVVVTILPLPENTEHHVTVLRNFYVPDAVGVVRVGLVLFTVFRVLWGVDALFFRRHRRCVSASHRGLWFFGY